MSRDRTGPLFKYTISSTYPTYPPSTTSTLKSTFGGERRNIESLSRKIFNVDYPPLPEVKSKHRIVWRVVRSLPLLIGWGNLNKYFDK